MLSSSAGGVSAAAGPGSSGWEVLCGRQTCRPAALFPLYIGHQAGVRLAALAGPWLACLLPAIAVGSRFGTSPDTGALQRRLFCLDCSQLCQAHRSRGGEELLGELDAVEDNRNDIAGDLFPVDLVVGADLGSEDQPDSGPFQGARAETKGFKCLQFDSVEPETGFAGHRVGGFSDPVQPDAGVDTTRIPGMPPTDSPLGSGSADRVRRLLRLPRRCGGP